MPTPADIFVAATPEDIDPGPLTRKIFGLNKRPYPTRVVYDQPNDRLIISMLYPENIFTKYCAYYEQTNPPARTNGGAPCGYSCSGQYAIVRYNPNGNDNTKIEYDCDVPDWSALAESLPTIEDILSGAKEIQKNNQARINNLYKLLDDIRKEIDGKTDLIKYISEPNVCSAISYYGGQMDVPVANR